MNLEKENSRTNKTEQPDLSVSLFWVIVAVWLLCLLFSKLAVNIRLPKKTLVDIYGVDKKSFNKWVLYFCSDIIPDMEAYKRRRTVSLYEYTMIICHFSKPVDHPILTKKEIIEKGEGTYYSLRECIKGNPMKFGLPSYQAFQNMQQFPPNISKRILEQYG